MNETALPLNHRFVSEAYGAGRVTTAKGDVLCDVRHVADLRVSSGSIVACDPLVFPDAPSFTTQVPSGSFPVLLAVAHVSPVDERVAFAMIKFSEEPADTWRMATTPGQDLTSLQPDHIFGYGVDAGTGCFMDQKVAVALKNRMDSEEEYYQTIIDRMEETYVDTWSWAQIQPESGTVDNCICFSSGWGDGLYASYFGFTRSGNVSCLVTDFDVLWRNDELGNITREITTKPWWKFW